MIANILETRKKEVVIVTKDHEEMIKLTEKEIEKGIEIENHIVSDLVKRHSIFMDSYNLT